MNADDPRTPRDVLGDPLWDALGAAPEPPPLPAGFDARMDARRAASASRELLGDELWDALGAVEPPPAPPADLAAVRRAAVNSFAGGAAPPVPSAERPAAPWRALGASVFAAAATALLVTRLRRRGAEQDPADLALVSQLAFAESLDLVAHPDFDVLLRWDGTPP